MRRILIIDDDPGIRTWLRKMFENVGCHVLEAGDGLAAMHILRQQPFDMAFCDLSMPEQGGLETILQIRQEGLGVPVVVMSASDPDELWFAVECGAKAALAKPFNAAEAFAAMETVLAR